MKAMVLAAGLGTRLRPLTDSRPKALVEVAGRTLLDRTLARLRQFGIRDVIINVHHFGGMIEDYLRRNHDFGMHIAISREDVLLDTGGGLKRAAWFLDSSGDGNEQDPPILICDPNFQIRLEILDTESPEDDRALGRKVVALINTYFTQNEVSHPSAASVGASPERQKTGS